MKHEGAAISPIMSQGAGNQEASLKADVLQREFNLKVTTMPIQSWLPKEMETHDFQVLVRVEAPRMVAEHTPIDLVAVLDVSGSMGFLPSEDETPAEGEQSRMDHLKAAMSFLIKKLHDDDRLAIVQFNHMVTRSTPLAPISGGGRESALRLVDELVPNGGTSFKPALEEAHRILGLERAKDNSSNRVAFIVFLSDGQEQHQQNSSWIQWDTVTAHPFGKELHKYPVYTFGFGRFHEPTALWGISRASMGTYSFVDNDLGKLKDAFISFCVGDLSTAVTVNATIALFARDGVTIVGIDSGGFDNAVNEEGRSWEIFIPMLCAGEVKNFIVHLRLRPAATAGQQVLFTINLNASDSSKDDSATEDCASIQRPEGDHGDGSCQPDKVVLEHVTRFKLLKLLEEVPKDELRAEPGREKWAKLLRKNWIELKQSSSLSNVFDEDVDEMVRKLAQEDLGHAHLCSYLSSQLMERATTKGSPVKTDQPPNPVDDEPAAPPSVLVPAAGDIQIPYGEQRKNLPVLLRVVAPPKGKEERAPIDLVLVIDVSGSMNAKTTSSKLPTRLSMAKAAALLFKNHLGQGDRLAIVPFNTDVVDPTELIEMNYNGRLLVSYRLMGLRAGGDDRFLPALKFASDLLRGRNKGDRPGFIFFISDGEDRSVLDPQALQAAHVSADYPVHTVGLWNKCNPESMVHIAKQTGGTFHPVNDDPSGIASVVGNFLAGILSVAAVKTHIDVHVTWADDGDEDDVRITEIESGSYPSDILHGGKSGKIHVGVLYAGEEKMFVVHLNIPAMLMVVGAAGATEQHVLAVSGRYNKPTRSESMSMDTKIVGVTRFVRGGPVSPPLLLPPTTMATTTTYIQLLIAEIVRIEVVHIVAAVLGRHKDAELKNKVISMELEAAWNKFKSSDHGSKVLQELVTGSAEWQQYARQVVEQHGDVINAMQASLIWEEHVGMQYVHAWLASHQAQRATTVASGAVTASSWSQLKYMEQTLLEVDAMSSSWLVEKEMDACKCVDLDRIDQRLDVWSRVKRDLPLLFQPSEDPDSHHLTAVFKEASLEAINRAMHHDMYLAIVHGSNLRRCYCAPGGKQQQAGHGGPSAAAPLLLAPMKPRE